MNAEIKIGLERIAEDRRSILESRRFGLVMNRASCNRQLRLACDLLAENFPGQLVSILTPQHGLWGEQQANMVETAHGFHETLRVPIYSLYSETRRPTSQMLDGLDCLVIDLQDAGTRVYTFIWTLLYCMQECASRQLPLIVLDRPNPIGGRIVEGSVLNLQYRSFVGEAAIPMRHGLTIGELARFFNTAFQLNADLTVVSMQDWKRNFWFDQLGRVWIPPSPNMPTVQTAVVYPGQVLLEGTNLSEGRGTTVPFEIVGAPFIEPDEFCRQLAAMRLPGVIFLPIRFTPAFDKWAHQSCGGVSIHVTDREGFRAYQMTVVLLQVCRRMYPRDFRWIDPPYEYEHRLKPIDIISGDAGLRTLVDSGTSESVVGSVVDVNPQEWWSRVRANLLYTESTASGGFQAEGKLTLS